MSRFLRGSLLAVGALVLLRSPVHGQVEPVRLDTVRVSVASIASPGLGAATRGVQVITAAEIAELPAASVTEVLQWALGVDLMPRSPALVDVSMRGSTFEQVLVMVDGVRTSDAQTGHFNLNLAVPLDQVERVEVLRGAASALYGSDAVGGVINIVTGRGAGSRVRLQAGSFGAVDAALSHVAALGRARVTAGADLRRSDGHRPGTDHRMLQGRVTVDLPLGRRVLSAAVASAGRDFGARGFYGSNPAWDEYEETRITTATLSLRPAEGARVAVEPTVSYRRHGDEFLLMRDDPAFYRNVHSTDQVSGRLIGRWAAAPSIRLAGGFEAFHDVLGSASLGDRSESHGAALAEIAAGSAGRAIATAGARIDWHEVHGSFVSPSLSAGWWPVGAVRLRASVSRALRTPTWTERYYRDPANEGTADLDPERTWSSEVGVEVEPVPAVRAGAALFQRDSEGLIDWARAEGSDAVWETRNVERARFRGVEAQASWLDPAGGQWSLQGSWLSVDSSTPMGVESKYALRPLAESVTAGADRPLGDRVSVSVRATRARRLEESAYLRVDGRILLHLERVRLHLDVMNAGDVRYLDVTRVDAAGRAVAVGGSVAF